MKHHYLRNASTLELNASRCIGCNMCTEVCPHGVLTVQNGKAQIDDLDSCMECGACSRNCPVSALRVEQGVGCAAAIIHGFLTGTEPSCDCSGSDNSCC